MSVCRQHRNTEKHRLQAGSSTSTDVKNSLTVVATVKKTWPGLERVNDGQGCWPPSHAAVVMTEAF